MSTDKSVDLAALEALANEYDTDPKVDPYRDERVVDGLRALIAQCRRLSATEAMETLVDAATGILRVHDVPLSRHLIAHVECTGCTGRAKPGKEIRHASYCTWLHVDAVVASVGSPRPRVAGSLKLCPFCGETDALEEVRKPELNPVEPCWVQCMRCGAKGSPHAEPEGARVCWNARAGAA